ADEEEVDRPEILAGVADERLLLLEDLAPGLSLAVLEPRLGSALAQLRELLLAHADGLLEEGDRRLGVALEVAREHPPRVREHARVVRRERGCVPERGVGRLHRLARLRERPLRVGGLPLAGERARLELDLDRDVAVEGARGRRVAPVLRVDLTEEVADLGRLLESVESAPRAVGRRDAEETVGAAALRR